MLSTESKLEELEWRVHWEKCLITVAVRLFFLMISDILADIIDAINTSVSQTILVVYVGD
jgi:hypothetical protein